MSWVMEVLPYSPDLLDTLIADIKDKAEKDITRKIIDCFYKKGLQIKVKHIFPNKPFSYYRVLCFIKKSKETVIINTKEEDGHRNIIGGLHIQLRIENKKSFEKLNIFNDNIRNQILNANDCRYCSPKCEGKCYIFSFNGKNYVKCQYLCSNFRFKNIQKNDIANIMDIVNGEIEYKG